MGFRIDAKSIDDIQKMLNDIYQQCLAHNKRYLRD